MALGLTQQLPVDDRHTYPRPYLEGQLAIMMGGRLAEELFLDTMTTGAGNDIEQATELARKMVCQFGMSSLGPMTFGKQEEQISSDVRSRSIAITASTQQLLSTTKFGSSLSTATSGRSRSCLKIVKRSFESQKRFSSVSRWMRPKSKC
jgi:ATP-dependent Zn protease